MALPFIESGMYKSGKWAKRLLDRQLPDGSWGNFHTLSAGMERTTEQALRRLRALGFTAEDEPIQKALAYLESCLAREREIPDRREKGHCWDLFVAMMLSVWIRFFTGSHAPANQTAARWADIVTQAFSSGTYDAADYGAAFQRVYGEKPRGGRLLDFVTFYQVALLPGELDAQTERRMIDYILHHESGIYYMCAKPVSVLPPAFQSRETSAYLAVIELLSQYRHSRDMLSFVVTWLEENRNENGCWDVGPLGKDGVYFPLSDSWRTKELRERDCTYRINRLIDRLSGRV